MHVPKRILLFILVWIMLIPLPILAQDQPATPSRTLQEGNAGFASLEEFQTALDEAVNGGDVEAFWQQIVDGKQMPLIFGDTAVFLYRGIGKPVEWRGDFTGWESSKDAMGVKQGDTDIWLMIHQFPLDARSDYKIVRDFNTWLVDPLNPLQQLGGFGYNSYFAMPDYVFPTATIAREDIEHGTLSEPIVMTSMVLEYDVQYQVYTPAGYDELENLPSLYITDGHEYANPEMGALVTVLDNLIADGVIQPIVAVFIDPRKPTNATINRREWQYLMKQSFANFIVTELVPTIDAEYKTNPTAEARAILGTSYGGLNSLYLGVTHSETFGLIAANSPALFRYGEALTALYDEADLLPLKLFISLGLLWDDIEEVQAMVVFLEDKGYPVEFVETQDGHSWGNWRGLMDDVLIYFFPA